MMQVQTLASALAALDARATVVDDLDSTLTGDELRQRVAAEIAWLRSHGAERVALAADNGVPWIVADLALHLDALPALPLPLAFTGEQRAHALCDAGVDTLLCDPGEPPDTAAGWRLLDRSPASGLALHRRPVAVRPRLPAGTAKITYTSGSTGSPKGVCLSAAHLETVASSLVAATRSLRLERHACLLPLSTLLENVAGVYAPLLCGARVLVPASRRTGVESGAVDPSRLLATLAALQPDSLVLVPELLRLLVVAAESGWRVPRSLRFVAVGGAVVSPQLLERATGAGLPVYEGYGLSECGSVVTLNTPQANSPGSAGRPLGHARLRIDDAGEIRVAGPLMLGYVGDPPRSMPAEYATGDLGFVDDDGYLHVRGRRRNVFITAYGRNVSPEWVEAELVQQPEIAQALVHGEGRPHAVALIVPRRSDVDAIVLERAVAAANARLPAYARVRSWLRASQPFTSATGELTANGRLRREVIERRYAAAISDLYVDAIAS
jgi:long-chain acyl-CoA synthetase